MRLSLRLRVRRDTKTKILAEMTKVRNINMIEGD